MRNRRQERGVLNTKCWTFLAILLITFLLLQMHFTSVKQKSPPPDNLNNPNDFFELQDAKRKSSHHLLDWKNWNIEAEQYVHSLSEIRIADMKHPQVINSPDQRFAEECSFSRDYFSFCENISKLVKGEQLFTNIGMSVVGLDKIFKRKMLRNLESLFEFSSVKYLHLIFVTDSGTLPGLRKVISHFLSRQVALYVIQDRGWRWRRMKEFPVVKVSYADINHIVGLNKPFSKSMKNVSKLATSGKYSKDLFYIAPMYHGAFLKLDKLIYLDASDIEFFDDVNLLVDQFSKMDQALIGVGLDKSPHYRKNLGDYLHFNPGSDLGLPGNKQGFNTGVVLFDLKRMRASRLYNQMINPRKVEEIQEKYYYKFTLGDQDWFTNLGWLHPELFYVLPCRFNSQSSVQYLKPPWEETFELYHHCDDHSKIVIFHRNG